MVARLKPSQVRFYPGEPAAFVTDPTGPVMHDLDRRMTRVQIGAQSQVGVRSGLLLSTIRKNPGATKTTAYVDLIAGRAGMSYTGAHHEGTRPHEIRPKRRKALRFVQGGRVVFRSRVWHPGTKPNRFMTDNLNLAAG